MDKPARRRRAGEAGAEHPEAPPLLILDPVVIADRPGGEEGAVGGPPFLGDALGTVGAPHPMRAAPPGKAKGRVVGQQPRRLDRLGRREQPDRPRRFFGLLGISPHPPTPPAWAPPSPASEGGFSTPSLACGGGLGWGLERNGCHCRRAFGDVA